MRCLRLLAPVFSILLAVRGPNCNAEPRPEALAEAVLFRQFDTVAYTHTNLLSTFDNYESQQHNKNAASNVPLALRLPFVLLASGLHALGGVGTASALEHSYTTFTVGARDFTPPEGLGIFTSHDCYIGIAEQEQKPDLGSVFKQATPDVIAGTPVWRWSMPPFDGYPKETSFYASQIAESYLLITNDRQVFIDVANELAYAKAEPRGILGWDAFSSHEYWIYRSPIRSIDSTKLGKPTSSAQAVVLFADIGKTESRVQVYLSDKTMDAIPPNLPAAKFFEYQHVGPGIWQTTIPWAETQATTNALYEVLYYLGFGVVL